MEANKEKIVEMLTTFDAEELFKLAREARDKNFPKATIRAAIEVSNCCRGNCLYCAMSRDNKELKRYKMAAGEIVKSAADVYKKGIKTIVLQSGEDGLLLDYLIPAIKSIKELMPESEIILCCGERAKEEYKKLKKAGADGYILKIETANPKLFKKLRPYSSLDKRLQCIKWIKEAGFKLGTGIICNLPYSTEQDLYEGVKLCADLKPDMASCCSFIPNENSLLKNMPQGRLETAIRIIAIFRILLPKARIPTTAPYERIEHNSQYKGFNAGADNITINATPLKYREFYQIYTKERIIITKEHAKKMIELSWAN